MNYEEGRRSAFDAEVHDVDEATHQVAVDFPITVDSYRTDFGPGCFQDAWDRFGLPAMVTNHNQDALVGRGIRGESLPDRHRLVGRFSSFDDVPAARAAFANIRDNIYPGWSFHYVQGETVPHPNGQRSVRRYTKARMIEFGPVLAPSIPGTQVVGLRSEEEGNMPVTPTISELRALREDGTISEEGYRAMLAEHYPDLRDHIVVRKPKFDEKAAEGLRTRLAQEYDLESVAALDAAIGQIAQGVAVGGASVPAPAATAPVAGSRADDDADGGSGDGDVTDASTLALDIDAALDQMQSEIGDTDTTTLPDNIQRALALGQAAGVVVDELLGQMGIEDPDDPAEGGRSGGEGGEDGPGGGQRADAKVSDAPWDFDASKYTPEQLHDAVLIPGPDPGKKEGNKLPVKEPDGTLNRNGVHAAAGALAGARGGVDASDEDKTAAAKKLVSLYHQLGEDVPQSILDLAGEGSRAMALCGDDVSEGDEVDHPDFGTGTVTNVTDKTATVHFPAKKKIASFSRKKADGKGKFADDDGEGQRSLVEDLEARFARMEGRSHAS